MDTERGKEEGLKQVGLSREDIVRIAKRVSVEVEEETFANDGGVASADAVSAIETFKQALLSELDKNKKAS